MSASGSTPDTTVSENKRERTEPSATLEVEVKFSAPDHAVVPGFDFVPGVASVDEEVREMSATYVDTADLRLTRAKRTLRRRLGGPDEGWHLKTPAEAGRMEYGADLDEGSVEGEGADATYTVPDSLLAPVRSIVREHQLGPIARVDNVRHVSTLKNAEGEAIAEFCDDHVTAVSLLPGGEETSWREWEIELIGDISTQPEGTELLERLGAVLRIAGATPSDSPSKLATALGASKDAAPVPPTPADLPEGTPGRAVVDALAANVAKMVEWDPKVRRDEWDSVHQMRVATRELRSHMQTFHGILVGEQLPHMESELKLLAGVLGVARDAEVVAERFENQLQRDEADVIDGTMREELIADIRRDYDRAHRRVVAALDSSRYLSILDQLDELLADPPVNPNAAEDAEREEAEKAEKAAASLDDADVPAEEPEDDEISPEETAGRIVDESESDDDEFAEEPTVEPAPDSDTDTETTADAPADSDGDADEGADEPSESDVETEAEAEAEAESEPEPAPEKSPEQIRAETNAVLAIHVAKAFKKFQKRHRIAVEARDDTSIPVAEREEHFHDVRKAAKKLRYSAEAAQSTGLPTKKLYAACKTLQSSLGDFQDTCTARHVLLQKARRAHSHDQDTFGYGVLYQIERTDGLKALEAYDDDVEGVLKAYEKLESKMEKAREKAAKDAAKKAKRSKRS
ncbi:MAG TPA: CHAD domain-containing protein [Corynebacterium sp.]|uniref:CYTH and CHAD domain-containing protein n=1 Tax=Corynebacterium sp. TaxID=1720 RepID=UPI00182CFB08|nr:CHAD domain-containing protein [Corynebacterium sp.]HHT31821.1 CHAD domain-containing protein [Corynebacterium sp.]